MNLQVTISLPLALSLLPGVPEYGGVTFGGFVVQSGPGSLVGGFNAAVVSNNNVIFNALGLPVTIYAGTGFDLVRSLAIDF